jgi:hypothetical protein
MSLSRIPSNVSASVSLHGEDGRVKWEVSVSVGGLNSRVVGVAPDMATAMHNAHRETMITYRELRSQQDEASP